MNSDNRKDHDLDEPAEEFRTTREISIEEIPEWRPRHDPRQAHDRDKKERNTSYDNGLYETRTMIARHVDVTDAKALAGNSVHFNYAGSYVVP